MSHRPSKRQSAPLVKLPAALSRRGTALIEQQMWCWGCDVRRADGNLLLAYGCQQRPSPEPRYHSAYTVALCAGCALTLWGWGVWIAAQDHGSLFISRGGFRLRWSSHTDLSPQAWQARDLPLVSEPNGERQTDALHLLREAVTWIAGYERWLADCTAPTYREQVVVAWPQRRQYKGGVPSCELANAWADFAAVLQETFLKPTEA
ncbi:MAG: hypothetical protein SGJ24_12525 [Chloroflexota bacterium]|nr:hypothetical protein [Chloroflexota bacterium]